MEASFFLSLILHLKNASAFQFLRRGTLAHNPIEGSFPFCTRCNYHWLWSSIPGLLGKHSEGVLISKRAGLTYIRSLSYITWVRYRNNSTNCYEIGFPATGFEPRLQCPGVLHRRMVPETSLVAGFVHIYLFHQDKSSATEFDWKFRRLTINFSWRFFSRILC